MDFRTAYGPRTPVRFATTGVSLTHQSMAKECDINEIMSKWQKTGILEHRNSFEGHYGDFTNLPMDYSASMNAVIEAETMFNTLPSSIRRKFGNDPGSFIDFVADPKNKDQLIEMGLAKKPIRETQPIPPETPPKAAPTPTPATATAKAGVAPAD